MKLKLVTKITFAVSLFIFWFGFAMPYLISAANNILVILGMSVTMFGGIALLVYIAQLLYNDSDNLKSKFNRRNR